MYPRRYSLPSDDIEEFITCLEIALKSAGTRKNKWKHSLLTQLTQSAIQPILSMMEDDSIGYADIKDILVSRNLTTSVAASEAFFSFQTNGLLHKIIAEGITRLRRWGRKIVDDATGPTQITDKCVMAILRSHFVHDLKQFLDIKEPKTVHEFEDLVKQWELTQSHKRSIYTKIGASQRYQSYTTSAQSPTRKPLTCYHRGKVGHIAKECRSKGSETPRQ